MTRGLQHLWMALTLAGCTCGAPEEAPSPDPAPVTAPVNDPLDPVPDGPNVLIILWDTVRADRMSLYGHDRPTTPKLDAFAADAAVFEHAISPGMWTLPTHASFFTGLPPQTHGANAAHRWLDDHNETLAERFDEAGWDTFAFSSNLVAGTLMNVTQGFDKQFFTYREPYKAADSKRGGVKEGTIPEGTAPAGAPGADGAAPPASEEEGEDDNVLGEQLKRMKSMQPLNNPLSQGAFWLSNHRYFKTVVMMAILASSAMAYCNAAGIFQGGCKR